MVLGSFKIVSVSIDFTAECDSIYHISSDREIIKQYEDTSLLMIGARIF